MVIIRIHYRFCGQGRPGFVLLFTWTVCHLWKCSHELNLDLRCMWCSRPIKFCILLMIIPLKIGPRIFLRRPDQNIVTLLLLYKVFLVGKDCCMFINESVFFLSHWMLLVAMLGTIVILIPLMIKRQETPTNYILLGAFVSCFTLYHCSVWKKVAKTLPHESFNTFNIITPR